MGDSIRDAADTVHVHTVVVEDSYLFIGGRSFVPNTV